MTGSDTPSGRPAPGGQPGGDPAVITVAVWHNVTRDGAGRHTGFHHGFRPGDQMVKVFTCQVFTCQTEPDGRRPGDIAEGAYAAFNGFPRDREAAVPAHRYRDRWLRSLSFPGNFPWCGRSCCLHRRVVWPRSSSARWPGERPSRQCQSRTRR